MLPNVEKITFLTGNMELVDYSSQIGALPVFSSEILHFLSSLSKEIMKDPRTRAYPDLTAYAFWIRKASLEKIRDQQYHTYKGLGRGVSFHIAPSNVPVAFALSFTAGLLAGNACIVRVSNKDYPQVQIISEAAGNLLANEFRALAPYLLLIRYDHDAAITQALSDICDVRVIWGGNRTISTIRAASLPPRAVELTFADRHSMAVIDADRYLEMNPIEIAENFYLDTYYIDQNACSSPRLVVWLGHAIELAQQRFWGTLERLVREKYDFQSVQSVDKLDAFCRLAVRRPEVRKQGNGALMRVALPTLWPDVMELKEGGGYFFEYRAETLSELTPVLGKPCQTVAYLGVAAEELYSAVLRLGVRGVDRIVPVGKTMELSLVWDGFDLVKSMSREIEIQ